MKDNETTLQVTMDADLKEQAEKLYQSLGTSLAEAVRMFARQSVEEGAMPFVLHVPARKRERRFDVARGKFTVPDDFDRQRGEIAAMFGMAP